MRRVRVRNWVRTSCLDEAFSRDFLKEMDDLLGEEEEEEERKGEKLTKR